MMTAVALLFSLSTNAHDFEVDGIFYNVTSETDLTVEVTYMGGSHLGESYNRYPGDVVIPSSVTYNNSTYTVTRIGDYTFYDCYRFTGLTIPNSVTSFGKDIFNRSTNLVSIVVESGNPKFDSRDNCNAIVETATNTLVRGCKGSFIPATVTSIGKYAFSGCTMTSIIIPNSVTVIDTNAFSACTALTSVTVPDSVVSIGGYAFAGCTGLTSAIIGNSVTSIGEYAFAACIAMTSITLGNSVTHIYGNAFRGCNKLTSIVVPNSVIYIGGFAFYDCSDLTSVTVPNSITSIGERVFSACTSLASITIPNSVTSIGTSAFDGCTGLTSITIPKSVTRIGQWAFRDCNALTEIICESTTPPTTDTSAFENVPTTVTLRVPYGAEEAYAAATGWTVLENNIVEMEKEGFDLTVTSAGYASLYLDYAVEIPSSVEVYTAYAVEGNRVKMQLVEGTLPASTGVIVKATAGTYEFNKADDNVPAIEDNLLYGTATDTYIKPAAGTVAYVLSMVDGEVGMYRAELGGDGAFLNNANKAYMLLGQLHINDSNVDTNNPGTQLGAGYRFDFGGTTGIGEVKGENGEVKGIFDLTGRKVNEITVPGIYIIDGKKTLVK